VGHAIRPNALPDDESYGRETEHVIRRRREEASEETPRPVEDDWPRLALDDEQRIDDEDAEEAEIVAESALDNEPAAPVEEPGLSVEPEDLGTQWLVAATEQGNFESSMGDIEEAGIQIITVPIKGPA